MKNRGILSIAFILVMVQFHLHGESTSPEQKTLSNEEFLLLVKSDIKKIIDRPVTKRDVVTGKKAQLQTFPKKNSGFIAFDKQLKLKINSEILAEGKQGWSANDRPENLFETDYAVEYNLSQLKTKAALATVPWSADYWAIALGQISYRYADQEIVTKVLDDVKQYDKVKFDTVKMYRPQPGDYDTVRLIADQVQRDQAIDFYSPAEKYDILVGDANFSLTRAGKLEGLSYLDKDGFVEMWMGICHGWAPAAYMYNRPLIAVNVLAADGKTNLTFYPDDIRALASLKWAKSRYGSRFVGGRCNVADKDIKKDEKTGKVLNAACLDTNPGTWHVVVANKIGIQGQSFVMDATFDYEVWNQPVLSYEVKFFDVKEKIVKANAQEATRLLEELGEEDPFWGVRDADPRAVKIVGVAMQVIYVAENRPKQGPSNKDELVKVDYYYDLELDEQDNIVGGEWYVNNHPDFLWTPSVGQQPTNQIDTQVKSLMGNVNFEGDAVKTNEALSNQLSRASYVSIQIDGSPLKYIIDGLVELSAREPEVKQPAVDESTPVVDESTPVVDESTPVVDESTPVVDESTPVVDESTPVVDESTPVVDESTPVSSEDSLSSVSETSPSENESEQPTNNTANSNENSNAAGPLVEDHSEVVSETEVDNGTTEVVTAE